MSVTYGFYNSINHDRVYDANQLSQLFDGLITDGVYRTIGSAFAVSVNSGMFLNVDAGRAWFNHTWILNDAIFTVEIPSAHPAYDRYDAIVLRIDRSTRENSITVKSGTAQLSPEKPELEKGPDTYEYPLAYILVAAGTTEIAPSAIEQRIGSKECPFVTGVVQGVSIDNLLKNWKDEFNILLTQLDNQISQVASKTLINKSVTNAKLSDDAVCLRFFNVTVPANSFNKYQKYDKYPFAANIILYNVKSTMIPEVVFSVDAIENNDLAPICECYDGGVRIFSYTVPPSSVKIETIICWRNQGESTITDDSETATTAIIELTEKLKSGSKENAELHLGLYLDEHGDLCQTGDE